MKRCIFYYPGKISEKPGAGSALRPKKMLEAFAENGYTVEAVTGTASQRKKKARELMKNIKNGTNYDFLYAENRNIPFALSDDDHFPRHPFFDLSFFRTCKKQGIPVGLFYRDVHWKFDLYKQVPFIKRTILVLFYKWELKRIEAAVNLVFLPSENVKKYIFQKKTTTELPPGGTRNENCIEKVPQKGMLHVFYVGNVTGGVYDVYSLIQAVKETENVYLTICAPKESWEQAKEYYKPVLNDRITVVHKGAEELPEYYRAADVFACCLQDNEYVRIAFPIKVFEAIGNRTPVIITDKIAAAEFVEKEGCGWSVPYQTEAFKKLFERLKENPDEIVEKTKRAASICADHTWGKRAEQVANNLRTYKKEKVK